MRVPQKNVLGEVNRGFAIANDLLSRQRIPYSAGCIGVAVKAHELALEYAGVRETFGAALSSRQAIQWMLVDNEIDIQQARWATLEAASHADRGRHGVAPRPERCSRSAHKRRSIDKPPPAPQSAARC